MLTLRMVGSGFVAGLVAAGALAVMDAIANRGYMFGLQTALFGIVLGGVMLLLAFLMAVASYQLSKAGRAPTLRRKLLASAIFTGPAGMACGFASAAIWAAAGQPWFP